MGVPTVIQDILTQKISHEKKIVLLNELLEKTPEHTIIHDFIRAEDFLIRKRGIRAADIYGEIAEKTAHPGWLVERQAATLARYAYFDIGSGPINRSFDIYTQKLGVEPEKAWKKIADILKRVKGYGYAAQCYANAGMPGTAARMFEKQLKQSEKAAWYYEQAGEWLQAARMYKKSKLHDKAGNCYAQAGMMKLAVKEWKKAGTLLQHNVTESAMQRILSR
jgi:tetratricopeptide (TPR) repeat protein